jgi:hypothetical protein
VGDEKIISSFHLSFVQIEISFKNHENHQATPLSLRNYAVDGKK